MRITRIESFVTRTVGLVRLTVDSGHTGWGQIATYEAADLVAQTLHRQVAPVVLGRDPVDRDRLGEAVIEANLKFPGSYICRALAAIDTATWDLQGKLEGKPVCELLGGSADPVPVYGSSMRRDITPEDEAERMARLREEQGFRAFKLRVGTPAGHNRDAWPGRTAALIPAVRQALGDEVTIHADANSCYTPDRAFEVGKLLEDHGYGHFEEPCPYWKMDWTQRVTAKLAIPVAGGEQDNWIPVWERMIRDHVVDIVQPDICYVGGVTRARQVARMAAEYGMLCVPHSANHSLVTVFTLHLWNALPNHGPFLEFSIEGQESFRAMFTPELKAIDGKVAIPAQGPGWGVTIDEEWLKKAEYGLSEAG